VVVVAAAAAAQSTPPESKDAPRRERESGRGEGREGERSARTPGV